MALSVPPTGIKIRNMTIDLGRFSRFLTIAQQSSSDGEALNAFRFACRMLDGERITFTEYLARIAAPIPKPPRTAKERHTSTPQPKKYQQDEQNQKPAFGSDMHKRMLSRLLGDDSNRLTDSLIHFLKSLSDSLETWKRLTDRQGLALERIYKQEYTGMP